MLFWGVLVLWGLDWVGGDLACITVGVFFGGCSLACGWGFFGGKWRDEERDEERGWMGNYEWYVGW